MAVETLRQHLKIAESLLAGAIPSQRACIEIFKDMVKSEVVSFPPSVQSGWEAGRILSQQNA